MKYKTRIFGTLALAATLLFVDGGYARPEQDSDKTLSPYFHVKGDDPETDHMPLKSTSVKVAISGVIADVVVTQVYKNEGNTPLEALYVFPASTKAAVYGMKMTIGNRTITAKIREREKARREYEQARQEGKSASLLEQQRPNVFQMNVANILPEDVIQVELRYTELLTPTDRIYEFVYPTVVGPRYSDQPASQAEAHDQWVANPYLHQGELPPYTLNMEVNLAAGLPIQDLSCPTHQTSVDYEGRAVASIRLDPSEKLGGNRDFVLKYRLAGSKVETGLLLFEGTKENHFLLMMQTPRTVSDVRIPPREYIFIVDVSGSMNGFPLNISKKLLKDLIGNLKPTDRFNVLLFAGGSSVMAESSLPSTQKNISEAVHMIERQRGGGGTRLLPALKKALSLPRTEGCSRSVIIVTDGYVAVEEEAFDLIRENLGDANMFAFGIGSSVNRFIIEGMARVGMGEPFVITSPEEAAEKAEKFRTLIQSPVLTNIKIDFGTFDVYDVEPPSVPDVLADRPVIVFGKWRGRNKGTISLQGITGERPYVLEIDTNDVKPSESNSALRYLWARRRISILSDYNSLRLRDERTKEVTRLGLTYNLLTAYTSFIAIDTRVRLHDGKAVTVKQPLPLPHGVSDYAVGRTIAGKGIRCAAPSTGAMPLKGRVGEESLEHKKQDHPAYRPDIDKARSETYIRLKKLTVSEGLSSDSVRSVIEKNIPALNLCCKQTAEAPSRLKGEVEFRLVVDHDGKVTRIAVADSRKRFKKIEQCIMQHLKKLYFQAPAGAGNVTVTVTFNLG